MSDDQNLYELEQALELAREQVARLRKAGTAEARAEREKEREAEQASYEDLARKERAVWSEAWALMRPDAGTTYPVEAILSEVRHLVARAESAEAREALLRSALEEFAEGGCVYGSRRRWCDPCKARIALTQATATPKPKSAAAAAPMLMHSTPPTEPGWYWAVHRTNVHPEVVGVVRSRYDGVLVVSRRGCAAYTPISMFDKWSDKLPEPEAGTEVK